MRKRPPAKRKGPARTGLESDGNFYKSGAVKEAAVERFNTALAIAFRKMRRASR